MNDPTNPKQILINPSAITTILPTLFRQAVLVFGGFMMVFSFLEARDIIGLYRYLESAEGMSFIAAAVVLGTLIYGQLRGLWEKAKLVTTGNAAPDSVAVVKGANPPPAVTDVVDAS